MKIRLTAEIMDNSGKKIVKTIEKEAEVPGMEEYGDPERFYEIFDSYERPVLKARNELLEEVTKEYLDGEAALKKGGKRPKL